MSCYIYNNYAEKLEVELAEFKMALSALYSDVHDSDVV